MVNKLHFERYSPFYLSTLTTATIYFVCSKGLINPAQLIEKLPGHQITISTTLLGFLLTILTIIQTINNVAIKHLKTISKYETVIKYLNKSIYLNIIAVIFALVLIISGLDKDSINYINEINDQITLTIVSLLTFICSMAIASTIRFVNIFVLIISSN